MNAVGMPMTPPAGDAPEESRSMTEDAVVMGRVIPAMTPAPGITSGGPDAVTGTPDVMFVGRQP